jgi:hypothetical protein
MLTQLTLRFAESRINELSLAQEWLKSSCIFSDKPLVLPLGSELKGSLKREESTVLTVQRKLPMNPKLILATVTDNTSKLPIEYSLPKRTIS